MDNYILIAIAVAIILVLWAYNGMITAYPIASVLVLVSSIGTFLYLVFIEKIK